MMERFVCVWEPRSVLQYWLFRLFGLLVPLVPPAVAYWLCDRIGDIAYLLLARQRRAVRDNLSRVLAHRSGGLEPRVREVFRQGAKYYYDTFLLPALSDQQLHELLSVDGWEHLDLALKGGKGAIVFTAHLGSPVMVAQSLAIRGYAVTTPMEPVKPAKLLQWITAVRASHGIKFVPLGAGCSRELVAALRRNEIVGTAVDRDLQNTAVSVRFFGTHANMPAGPAMLALRTGAALVPAFTQRLKDGRMVGHIGEQLRVDRTGKLREDVRANTEKIVAELERAIGSRPEQWIVFEHIWPAQAAEDASGAGS